MPKTQKSHGGSRPGSGRKPANPEGTGEKIAASVPAVLVQRLDAVAAKHGWTRIQAVAEAIRRFVR